MVKIGTRTRHPYYDRSAWPVIFGWVDTVGAHGQIERFRYTVPTGKKAICALNWGLIKEAIATAGAVCIETFYAGLWIGPALYTQIVHHDGSGYMSTLTTTPVFTLPANYVIKGTTYSTDTIPHMYSFGFVATEFDA